MLTKTALYKFTAAIAICSLIMCLCACDGWFNGKATPTLEPTAQATIQPDSLQVHFIDVGQGDAILIDLGATEVLIDAGDRSPGVIDYIDDYVDGHLEAIVATHPHADHIGGLIEVLDEFDVDEVWICGYSSTSKTYNDFMDAANSEAGEVLTAERGDTITAGTLTFSILHPVEPLFDDSNNNSIVLLLHYGNIDFLFEGDAEIDAEASMISAGIISDVDILKVGHHCSRTASSPAFLNITMPEVAVYMAKIGNTYGHPHTESLSALQSIGATIYGTDTLGTIVINTDGNSYTLQAEK